MSDGATVPLEILIQIRDELAGLNRARAGLQGAKKDADSFGSALRQGLGIGSGLAIAASGIALLTSSLKATVGESFRLATETINVARANEMSIESYQVLKDLIEDTGGEVGSLTMSLKEMREAMNASGQGGGAAEAFRTLKIDAEAFSRLPVEGKLEAIAKATFSAESRTTALGAASEILGSRNLPKLTNALRTLATDGYAKVAEEAKKAGQIMSDDTARRLHEAELRIKNLKDSIVIGVGETMGVGGALIDSSKQSFFGTAWDFIRSQMPGGSGMAALGARLAANAPGKPAGPDTPGPSLAKREDILQARIGAAEWKAGAVGGNPLLTETQQRQAMVRILDEQVELYTQLIQLKYADVSTNQPQDGATEEQLQRWKERNELEQKLAEIRRSRMEQVDTPMMAMLRQMGDTTALINNSLAQGTSQAINQLGNDIWEAAKGTQSWSQAWRNMGDIAGRMLTQILTQMIAIQAINAVLGIFGYSMTGAGPSVGKIGATTIKAGGGGSFMTSGPTNLTVGDNPGGRELVSVIPVSGIGQTMVNGRRAAMAGGGTLLAGGTAAAGGGDTFIFNYAFNGGVSRQEVLGLIPTIVEASKGAVLEARRRGRDGFR